jgi:hypothetical protein
VVEFSRLLHLHRLDAPDYDPLQSGWNNCTFTGAYAAGAQRICESILSKMPPTGNNFYTGVSSAFNYADDFSIMARLSTGQFFCVGSSGGTYEGPVSGWSGSGCYANP